MEASTATTRAPGMNFTTSALAFSMKSGTAATGTETSCSIEPPSGFCEWVTKSRRSQNERRCCRLVAITASSTRPSSIPRERIASSVSLNDGACDVNSISTYQG